MTIAVVLLGENTHLDKDLRLNLITVEERRKIPENS